MTQKEKTNTDKVIKKIKRLAGKSLSLFAVGKWNESMKLINQGDELIMSFQGYLPKELEASHCLLLYTKVSISLNRGFLELFFKLNKEYLTLAKEYGNKTHIAVATYMFGFHYRYAGDLKEALMHTNSGIALMEECFNNDDQFPTFWLAEAHYAAIIIIIERNELEQAGNYFKRLEEIHKLKPNDPLISIIYLLSKADLLKSSKRARDRVKAEKLYKKVYDIEITPSYSLRSALIGRCELLLIELKLTNEIEIIDEIKPLLEELIDLAQQRESDFLLAEVYVLQGKLALLTFEMKIARRFLVQAQRIAEKRGYKSIAEEITRLHEELKGDLDEWEDLKQQNAPLSERIKLSRLDEDTSGLFKNRIVNREQVIEKKVTVYSELKTCVVCKGSAIGFNIYVCPQCSSIYCKGCAKAVVELENACWTCESPIDKTKPSQLLEREEEKTKIETKSTKKNSQK